MSNLYIDSCLIIYYVEGTQAMQQKIASELKYFQTIHPMIAVSDLTRLECRIKPLRDSDLTLLSDYDRFFDLPEIQIIDFTTEIFDRATELRAKHRLTTPDALHMAAALSSACSTFWTNDLRLASLQPLISIKTWS